MKKVVVQGDVGQVVAGDVRNEGPVQQMTNVLEIHSRWPAGAEGPAVIVDEQQFAKLSKMRASAPARLALLRLLEEDVTTTQLAKIWRDELTFSEPHFKVVTHEWIPKMVFGLMLVWVVSILVCILGLKFLPTLIQALAIVGAGLSTFLLAWLIPDQFYPYVIAKKVEPMVARVNAEMPTLLAEWRRAKRRAGDVEQ